MTLHVWYSRYDSAAAREEGTEIWRATAASLDGTWTEQELAIAPGAAGEWDESSVYTPEVIKVGDTYYLFYTANDGGGRWSIGVATASDPSGPWVKHESNPILQNATDAGNDPAWDDYRVDEAYPLQMPDGSWRLYYKGRTAGQDRRFGLATTSEANFPAGWVKHSGNPIFGLEANGSPDAQFEGPVVIRWDAGDGEKYYLLATEAAGAAGCKIFESDNGIDGWGESDNWNSVETGELDAWSSYQVHGWHSSLLGAEPSYILAHGRQSSGDKNGLALVDLTVW